MYNYSKHLAAAACPPSDHTEYFSNDQEKDGERESVGAMPHVRQLLAASLQVSTLLLSHDVAEGLPGLRLLRLTSSISRRACLLIGSETQGNLTSLLFPNPPSPVLLPRPPPSSTHQQAFLARTPFMFILLPVAIA